MESKPKHPVLNKLRWGGEVVGYIVDLIVLSDYLTTRGVLSYLITSIGTQAQTIYNIIVVVVLVLAFSVPFYFGYRVHAWRNKKTAPKPNTELQPHSRGLEVYTRSEVIQRFPYETFVSQVQHGGELALLVGAFSTRRYDVDTIKRLITEKNATVTILLLAPTIYKKVGDGMIDMTVEIGRDFQWKSLIVDIQQTLNVLCDLRRDLKDVGENHKDLRSHLIIRTYDRTPTLSMIVIDPTKKHAIMQVGTYLSGPDANARFQIILSKKAMKNVFKKYWTEYELILDKHSHEINYKKIESEFLS